MDIDKKTYNLSNKNYHKKEFIKHQIIIGNSFSENLNHLKRWEHRLGGEYTKTSTFTIDRKGNIYQHYDPKYYSDFIGDKMIDKKIISITIENQGWLLKDLLKDKYIDWVGNIYKRRAKVIEKKWRGFIYWDPYTNSQIKACEELLYYLCEKYNITCSCVGHNTYIDGIESFAGITYRSNFYKEKTDLSPAWNFSNFKNKIEKKYTENEST
jgi:N-acetyl-anhydromuramyl-L-alanine amidase AmpD